MAEQSLFGTTPEALMASRDDALRKQAAQYAQLDPFQQATMSIYQGANKLGGAVGGMLGGQDPEMMRIKQRQQILQNVNPNSPDALKQGIEQAMAANDYPAAQELAKRYQDLLAKQASTAKDAAAATKERQLAIPADLLKAQREAALKQGIRALAEDTTPEGLQTKKIFEDELAALTRAKETAPSDLAKLLSERAKLNPVTDKASYDAYTAKIKKLTTGKSLGQEIGEGLSPVLAAIVKGQAQKSGEAGGTDVGKQIAAIEGKYTALNSVQDALNVVKKGIYAGGYGPLQEGLAKYSGGVLADKQRLVNTEEFRSYIGNVVIPRLAEFGGNDSVEELKYLRAVTAGETTMESKAIERILTKAQEKIQRGITRIQDQQRAIAGGKQLPTGPTDGGVQQRTTKSGVTYTKED